jgi:hypothetical protein
MRNNYICAQFFEKLFLSKFQGPWMKKPTLVFGVQAAPSNLYEKIGKR